MKEPGGPFQRCLATCARERAAREAEEKEAKKFEEYLYANVNLETGEMLAPEEAPSLLPAGDAPAATPAAPALAAPAPAAAAPSAKRPRVPDGGASAPKRRRREGEQRCSNPTCPRPEYTCDCWRSSRDGSGEVLCHRCYYRQVGSRSRPRPFHMRTSFEIPSSDCLIFRLFLPLRRSRRRGSPRAASAPGWSRPRGATPGRTTTSSFASPATTRRCVRSPRPTGLRCPLRARSTTNDPSLPSVPSQPPPGVTACGKCARVESSQWRHSRSHPDLILCDTCHKKEVRTLTPTDRLPMPSPRAIDD